MNNILIIGAKQHAQVIVDAIRSSSKDMKIVGYLDDNADLQKTEILGAPVLGILAEFDDIVEVHGVNAVFLGISARHIKVREQMQERINTKGLFKGNIVHKTSFLSNKAVIGEGNYFAPFIVVNSFAEIGTNCVLYSGAVVDHHTSLGNNVYVGPNASLAADITIGDNTYIGVGAVIIPHVKVGSNVTLGAGTVVIEDIPDNAVVVGVPGKVIKFKD